MYTWLTTQSQSSHCSNIDHCHFVCNTSWFLPAVQSTLTNSNLSELSHGPTKTSFKKHVITTRRTQQPSPWQDPCQSQMHLTASLRVGALCVLSYWRRPIALRTLSLWKGLAPQVMHHTGLEDVAGHHGASLEKEGIKYVDLLTKIYYSFSVYFSLLGFSNFICPHFFFFVSFLLSLLFSSFYLFIGYLFIIWILSVKWMLVLWSGTVLDSNIRW